MKPWQYDGMRMGDAEGRWFRVFEPRWWQFDRWLLLLRYRFWRGFDEPVAVVQVTLTSNTATVRVRAVSCVRIK